MKLSNASATKPPPLPATRRSSLRRSVFAAMEGMNEGATERGLEKRALGVFPPIYEYEGNAERDLSEKNGERESRKQAASDEGKCVSAGHKQARADRML